MGYSQSIPMNALRILQTTEFTKWYTKVRDPIARASIAFRIERAAEGNLGVVRTLPKQVSEMKVDVGQGYRVYFTRRGGILVILLCGGTKTSQQDDIKRAQTLAQQIED